MPNVSPVSAFSRWIWPAVMAVSYAVAVAIMNPLREYPFGDDWAYALTVRRLVETGIYAPHDFVASNFPFQAAWGALFAQVLGFSMATLHLSTLVVMLLGLGGFFVLAREHGLDKSDAFLLTFMLAASPLVLEFSVTFMTDVPFMALIIVALAFYTRGLRRGDLRWMLAGSVPAACAVLTRQFGVAIVAGLALTALFNHDRKNLRLVATGALLPLAASTYQIAANVIQPNWSVRAFGPVQTAYLLDFGHALAEGVWRLDVTLHYMALFCLPLIGLLAVDFVAKLRSLDLDEDGAQSPEYRLNARLLLLLPLIMAISAGGVFLLGKPGTLPLVSWNFDVFALLPRPLSAALTLVTLLGAFLLARLIVVRLFNTESRLPHQSALDWITACLLGSQLILFQFGDEYLLPILPYVLIVVGTALVEQIKRWRAALTVATIALLFVSSWWAQGIFNGLAAQWQAAQKLLDSGAVPDDIYAVSWEWDSYHGAFDAFLASGKYDQADGYSPYFDDWLPQRLQQARYVIFPADDQPLPEGLRLIERIPYQDGFSGQRVILVVEKLGEP